MPDIKWIKLATNMHEDEKMRLIDAMPERDAIHYFWIRLLLLAGKTNANGEIFLSGDMPLTAKMLAILFSRPLSVVNLALKTLSRLGMIEIDTNKIIRIVNWDKHQNIEGMERVREQNRKRAENHREKKKQEKKAVEGNKEIDENIALDEVEELEPIEVTLEEHETLNENEVIRNLENSEEINTDFNDDKTNVNTDVERHNNVSEDIDNNSNVTKNIGNVMENKSNVTVTEQNKKEIENKNKNKKKEIDKDKDKDIENKKNNDCGVNNKSLTCDLNNKNSTCDEELNQSSIFEQHNNTKSESAEEEDINLKALELMHYHEKITGKVGGCDYFALRSAIDIHGEKRVKMAMDVGFKRNCPDIKYAIGVLKNWRRDGYPENDMEVKTNGVRSAGKNNSEDKNRFAGFKPKEPRKLTEAERKQIEATII